MNAAPDLAAIRVGDRITFRAATRSGCRKATRVVTGTPGNTWHGGFSVKSFHGWSGFVVRPGEVVGHQPAETGR